MVATLLAAALALWPTFSLGVGGQDGSPEGTMIARANGPFQLGTTALSVPLASKGAIAAPLDRLAPGQRLFLILNGLSAAVSPETPFSVYINLPPDADKATTIKHRVGRVTFFNEIRDGSEYVPTTFRSFDVTEKLAELSAASGGAGRAPDSLTVTILPERKSVVAAKATIRSVELVAR